MRTSVTRRRVLLATPAAVAGLTIALTGCSVSVSMSDGPDRDEAPAAVEDWLDDLLTGDAAAACAGLTEEYAAEAVAETIKTGWAEPGSSCEQVMTAIGATAGGMVAVDGYEAVLVEGAGDRATVQVTHPDGSMNDTTYEVTYVDDRWLISGDRNKATDRPSGKKSDR